MTKLSFCQNYSPMGKSFWQKNSLVTHILFDLCLLPIMMLSPFANFGKQPLCSSHKLCLFIKFLHSARTQWTPLKFFHIFVIISIVFIKPWKLDSLTLNFPYCSSHPIWIGSNVILTIIE